MIMINKSNANNNPRQTIHPNNAIIGIQLIFGFCLNGRAKSGLFFRRTIKLKLTKKKLINTPNTVA